MPDSSGLVNSGLLNPDSWEGVLSPAEYPFELETRTATDSAKSDNDVMFPLLKSYDIEFHEIATDDKIAERAG